MHIVELPAVSNHRQCGKKPDPRRAGAGASEEPRMPPRIRDQGSMERSTALREIAQFGSSQTELLSARGSALFGGEGRKRLRVDDSDPVVADGNPARSIEPRKNVTDDAPRQIGHLPSSGCTSPPGAAAPLLSKPAARRSTAASRRSDCGIRRSDATSITMSIRPKVPARLIRFSRSTDRAFVQKSNTPYRAGYPSTAPNTYVWPPTIFWTPSTWQY